MTQLTMTINALKDENTKFKKSLKDAAIADSANEIFSLVLTCFRCLSQWSCIVQSALAWKYRHPVTIAQLKARNIPVDSDGIEYEQVLRYNLSSDELTIMVDVISMIKSLSSSLAQAEALFAPIIRFHIHHAVQQLVQGDLLPLLHRIDKRNKSKQLAILLQIRTLAADWLEGIEPREDYKQYTRRQGQISAFAHPPRVVATSATQLHLLRSYIFSINYEKSSFRSKNGIMGKPDLEKEDVKALEQFNKDSFYFPYMLSFSDTLRCVSDLSDLWYREYFLELTRCIQFPIEMSLPWILIDHILSNRNANGQGMTDGALTSLSSTPMVENVLFLTDMYNDVAHRALYVLNQQFLYDEIESEANLVLDQLIFLLSDEVYSYYKDFISSLALDVTMKKKLEDIKKERYLTIPKKRYEAVLAQRHLHLLGRAINLNFLIGQHINNKLYKDIEVALLRFESSDLSGLTDLKTSLDILKHLHGALAQFIELDSFDSIFNEIDETVSPTTLRGRVTTHIVCSLTLDLIPNFSYNYFTHRFVRSPIPARAIDYGKAPKTAALTSLFGTTCYKAHDSTAKLLCGFFGRPHIEALLYLTGYNDMASIIDECFTILRVKIEDVAAYVDALWEGIMPCKLPKYMFRSSGCYGYFEGKLRTILEYEDLKPEVFQSFREIGNVVAFLKDLSDVLDVADQFQFNAFAPLLGVNPTDSVENVETKTTPLGAIFHDIAAAVGIQIETSNYQSSSMESMSRNAANLTSNSLASQLPVIADTLVNSMSLVMTQKSLIRQTLAKVEEYMDEFKLKITWAVKSEDQLNTAYTAIDIENASGESMASSHH
jgi:cytoplasmic FMR1 interacting protein